MDHGLHPKSAPRAAAAPTSRSHRPRPSVAPPVTPPRLRLQPPEPESSSGADSPHGSDPISILESYDLQAEMAHAEGQRERSEMFKGLAAKERKRLKEADDEVLPPWRAAASSSAVKPPTLPWQRSLVELREAAASVSARAASTPAGPARAAGTAASSARAADPDDYPPEYYDVDDADEADKADEADEPAVPVDSGDAAESVLERPKKRRRGKPRCRPGSMERRLPRLEKELKKAP